MSPETTKPYDIKMEGVRCVVVAGRGPVALEETVALEEQLERGKTSHHDG